MIVRSLAAIVAVATLLLAEPGRAADPDPAYLDYDQLNAGLFWRSLYPEGGWTLYCGYQFDVLRRSPDGRAVDIDHLYPISDMLRFLACPSRMECREREPKRFGAMESDMHNLYPVWQPMITYRNGRAFGEVPGEDHRFDDCDLEWRNGVLEPRPLARGNVARAILYMHERYGLPVDPAELSTLRRWHRDDPPSRQEQQRNDLIERLQGNRNPYVDDPARTERTPQSSGRQRKSEKKPSSGS